MQDRDTSGHGDALRRAVLFVISLGAVVAAAVVAPRLGWPAGLGLLGMAVLVLVVLLLAVVPDDEADEASSDPVR